MKTLFGIVIKREKCKLPDTELKQMAIDYLVAHMKTEPDRMWAAHTFSPGWSRHRYPTDVSRVVIAGEDFANLGTAIKGARHI